MKTKLLISLFLGLVIVAVAVTVGVLAKPSKRKSRNKKASKDKDKYDNPEATDNDCNPEVDNVEIVWNATDYPQVEVVTDNDNDGDPQVEVDAEIVTDNDIDDDPQVEVDVTDATESPQSEISDTVPHLECPSDSAESFNFNSTSQNTRVKLSTSSSNTLCTLVQIVSSSSPGSENDNKYLKPVARSYNGRDWEVSAGAFAGLLDITCENDSDENSPSLSSASTTCTLTLPELLRDNDNDSISTYYQLTSFEAPQYTERDVIARFLEQATFGPTLRDIGTLIDASTSVSLTKTSSSLTGAAVFANWISQQQDNNIVPPTSHRAIYRRRMNARFDQPSPQGGVTHACQQGTRYRRFAFSNKDIEKIVTIASIRSSTKKTLSVDGYVRTVVVSTYVALSLFGVYLVVPLGVSLPRSDMHSIIFIIRMDPSPVLTMQMDNHFQTVHIAFAMLLQ
jgi:hypothetical protein